MSQGPRKAAMGFIFITVFIDILGIGIIIPVLPELIKQFAGGDTALAGRYVGVISASYALMQFVFAPILGALSDRFGRRSVLLISLFGLGIDYIIQGLAPSLTWLFVGRVVAGIMGSSITTANAYIADVSDAETRARNYGLLGVAFGLGFIFGPAIGGLLGGVHLRLPFFVAAGLALVNWLYGLLILPESLPPEKRSPFTLRKANPISSVLGLRRYPLVAGLAVAFVFLGMAQRGLENVWVLYMGFRHGWDEMTNGLALAFVGVSAAVVQGTLVRPFIKRFGEQRTIIIGLSIGVFNYLAYALATEGWMIFVIVVVGALGGVAGPAIQGLVAGAVSPSEQGSVQGSLTSLNSLTSVFAPLIFSTALFGYFSSPDAVIQLPGAPFFFGAMLILVALVWLTRLFGRMPSSPASAPTTADDTTT